MLLKCFMQWSYRYVLMYQPNKKINADKTYWATARVLNIFNQSNPIIPISKGNCQKILIYADFYNMVHGRDKGRVKKC